MCRDVLQRVSTFVVVAKNKYYCGLKKYFANSEKKCIFAKNFATKNFAIVKH